MGGQSRSASMIVALLWQGAWWTLPMPLHASNRELRTFVESLSRVKLSSREQESLGALFHLLVVFLRGRQGLIEIPQEIIEALQPNGNADHIRAEASRDLLLIGQLLMRCAARVNHQAFGVAHIGQMRVNLDGLDKTPSSGATTFNAKGKNRPGPFGEVLLGTLIIGAIGQTRVTHPGYIAVLVQPLGDGHGVLHMALHTQGQRLQALQK